MADFPKLPRIKQDDENMEKLHCAARRGQTELVKRLTTGGGGIDPQIANKFGCTALHLACKHGQVACVRELAPLFPDLTIAWHGRRPLQLAIEANNQEVVEVRLDSVRSRGRDVAAVINECDEYETVIDYSSVGLPSKVIAGQTVLHYLVSNPNLPMLKFLLAQGGSPNAKDRATETVLMRAIALNREAEFEELIHASDLRVDAGDRMGVTPLHLALTLGRLTVMARKLFDLGADVNIEDQNKNNAVLLCIQAANYQLLEPMLEKCDPFILQGAAFHNGTTVLMERLTFAPFVAAEGAAGETAKAETVKVLQKRLDYLRELNKPAEPEGGEKKKKKKKADGSESPPRRG